MKMLVRELSTLIMVIILSGSLLKKKIIQMCIMDEIEIQIHVQYAGLD